MQMGAGRDESKLARVEADLQQTVNAADHSECAEKGNEGSLKHEPSRVDE